jgi:alkylated DNA repair dioxygenase AlkB
MSGIKPELDYSEEFYSPAQSAILYRRLCQENLWPDNRYSVAGRRFTLPRLQTWHADAGIKYSYSNNLLQTQAWTPLLSEIRAKVEHATNGLFNAVLVNWYRNGDDYVGWHSDNEPELGAHPLIASLTLGVTRQFDYKHKTLLAQGGLALRSGSLLIMQPSFQHDWLHRVPADKTITEGRINLTFRRVFPA